MSSEELAKKILELTGGEKNIVHLTNCVTRLRFNFVDKSKVKVEEIEKLPFVLGVQYQGEQFQIILGGKVTKVAEALKGMVHLEGNTSSAKNTKGFFSNIVETLASILSAILPAVIAGGMLKGLTFVLTNFNLVDPNSDTMIILNLVADCMFYFMPFLLASSAAKKFGTNEYLALAVAGALMYPSIINAATAGDKQFFEFFGFIPILVVNYKSSVIPIILSVLLLKYVYQFFTKVIPEMVNIIFAPLLTLLIVIPVSLATLAPLGFYLGEYIAYFVQWLIDFNPWISGFVLGATRPLLVLTGMHHALNPITQQQLSTFGYSTMTQSLFSTIAQSTAAFVTYFIVKNKKEKQIALSATISGYIGITEPVLYGILVKYKEAMIAACLGGGIGAAVGTALGAKSYGFVMPGILTLPAYMGEGFNGVIIGLIVSFVATIVIMLAFSKKIRNQSEEDVPVKKTPNVAEMGTVFQIYSPARGTLLPITEVNDPTFAKEIVGKGVAIKPESTEITAPFDGVVTTVFPTKHAIGLTSNDGVELLLHLGIDTVNLEGKYFDIKISEGDIIKKGQVIASYNYSEIEKEGYDATIMIVVTNYQLYLNVLPFEKSGKIFNEEQILNVIS